MGKFRPAGRLLMLVAVTTLVAVSCVPPKPPGPTVPPGSTVPPAEPEDSFLAFPMIDGLTAPVNVEFAPNGRVFVAEKAGIIKTYDSIDDNTPTIAADITAPVRNTGDHGLLGMTVDPQYPARPYIYVLHTWDITGFWGDGCLAGYGTNGCRTGARLSRIELDANAQMVGAPTTIVDDRWCMQFASHGVGDLNFLDDGTLIATAGEGAYWTGADYGQHGGTPIPFQNVPNLTPKNPCGDPPTPVGTAASAALSEGGSFRAQDVLTEGDPVTWSGSIVRIDPDTGEAAPDNPLVGVGSPDDDAVIAHGNRNPFRFTIKPGTNEIFSVDVGLARYEEINKTVAGDDDAKNFGWPCREGNLDVAIFAALNNNMCALQKSPQARTTLTDPWFAYSRLGTGGAIASITYLGGDSRYPDRYDDSLIFSDYVLGTTWSLGIDQDGTPAEEGPVPVSSEGINVDLETGPDGYVYAVDYLGSVNRLVDKDSAPVAKVTATPDSGAVPLAVTLDASESAQSGGGALTYLWDLDDDGEFDDAAGVSTSLVITEPEDRKVSVKVTNVDNASSVASTTIYAGNTAPQVAIDVTSPLPWAANDDISFTVSATDAEDGVLAESAVSWAAEIHHCYEPDDCHMHPYVDESGSSSGTISGPSHGFPSYLLLVAEATDSRGQTTTVSQELHPATVNLGVTSSPSGAQVAIGEEQLITPFNYTAIKNDNISLAAPTPQTIGGNPYVFSAWGHGGTQAQQYVASANANINLIMTPAP